MSSPILSLGNAQSSAKHDEEEDASPTQHTLPFSANIQTPQSSKTTPKPNQNLSLRLDQDPGFVVQQYALLTPNITHRRQDRGDLIDPKVLKTELDRLRRVSLETTTLGPDALPIELRRQLMRANQLSDHADYILECHTACWQELQSVNTRPSTKPALEKLEHQNRQLRFEQTRLKENESLILRKIDELKALNKALRNQIEDLIDPVSDTMKHQPRRSRGRLDQPDSISMDPHDTRLFAELKADSREKGAIIKDLESRLLDAENETANAILFLEQAHELNVKLSIDLIRLEKQNSRLQDDTSDNPEIRPSNQESTSVHDEPMSSVLGDTHPFVTEINEIRSQLATRQPSLGSPTSDSHTASYDPENIDSRQLVDDPKVPDLQVLKDLGARESKREDSNDTLTSSRDESIDPKNHNPVAQAQDLSEEDHFDIRRPVNTVASLSKQPTRAAPYNDETEERDYLMGIFDPLDSAETASLPVSGVFSPLPSERREDETKELTGVEGTSGHTSFSAQTDSTYAGHGSQRREISLFIEQLTAEQQASLRVRSPSPRDLYLTAQQHRSSSEARDPHRSEVHHSPISKPLICFFGLESVYYNAITPGLRSFTVFGQGLSRRSLPSAGQSASSICIAENGEFIIVDPTGLSQVAQDELQAWAKRHVLSTSAANELVSAPRGARQISTHNMSDNRPTARSANSLWTSIQMLFSILAAFPSRAFRWLASLVSTCSLDGRLLSSPTSCVAYLSDLLVTSITLLSISFEHCLADTSALVQWLIKIESWQWIRLITALIWLIFTWEIMSARQAWYQTNTSEMRETVMGWRETYWDHKILQYVKWHLQIAAERQFGFGRQTILT